MAKSYCAIDCTNRLAKESELSFYRIPKATKKRMRWITVIHRHNWNPGTKTWICGHLLKQMATPTVSQYLSPH
uniref:THAP-type domain-containing protein n=1 Tax=Lates calcarifer TaxID=8187 RepID=A0A4W6C3U9_LATCA